VVEWGVAHRLVNQTAASEERAVRIISLHLASGNAVRINETQKSTPSFESNTNLCRDEGGELNGAHRYL